MRIRPSLVTGAATIIAFSAVGVIFFATEPAQAQPQLVVLLWSALFIACWGVLCTLLLLLRQSMASSLWTALLPAIATVAALILRQRAMLGPRLLQGMLSATLMLSVLIWWRIRRMQQHAGHA